MLQARSIGPEVGFLKTFDPGVTSSSSRRMDCERAATKPSAFDSSFNRRTTIEDQSHFHRLRVGVYNSRCIKLGESSKAFTKRANPGSMGMEISSQLSNCSLCSKTRDWRSGMRTLMSCNLATFAASKCKSASGKTQTVNLHLLPLIMTK